ncbi:MAG: 30S ribosomal protein S24e [Candidatus Heimdallarchaeota archaeon]|nr:30S ribosomal protein S24e [Candidatus Heimdallarchaeota archaeon]
MEIEINEKKNNPLFKRTEVNFTVVHPNEGTPNRAIIQSELADALNTKRENIIIDSIKSGFGVQKTKGYAKVYTSRKIAESIERKHQLERNNPSGSSGKKEKDVKKTEEKPAEEPAGEPAVESKEESKEEAPEEKTKEKEAAE